jgi:ABC-type multidrug transport system fused ATPase/permease subunit
MHSYVDIIYAYAVLRASRDIHRRLIASILGTTLRWLDLTPASRVIARFTADITAGTFQHLQGYHRILIHPTVDGPILNVFLGFVRLTLAIVTSFGAVIFLTPSFTLPGVLAAIIGGAVGQLFIKVLIRFFLCLCHQRFLQAQLSVKRESSNAKAPVLGQ